MIEYFQNNLKNLTQRGVTDATIKYTIQADGYYHKFIAGDIAKSFLKYGNINKLIDSINKHSQNLIEEWESWPDFGAVYLKCRKVDFHYFLNTKELINKFDNTDAYLDYVINNATAFSRAVYPCHFNDWHSWNVAIQKDLSWIVIDMDDMIQWERHGLTQTAYATELIYKTARKGSSFGNVTGGDLDKNYVEDYIRNYFVENPNRLDFIEQID